MLTQTVIAILSVSLAGLLQHTCQQPTSPPGQSNTSPSSDTQCTPNLSDLLPDGFVTVSIDPIPVRSSAQCLSISLSGTGRAHWMNLGSGKSSVMKPGMGKLTLPVTDSNVDCTSDPEQIVLAMQQYLLSHDIVTDINITSACCTIDSQQHCNSQFQQESQVPEKLGYLTMRHALFTGHMTSAVYFSVAGYTLDSCRSDCTGWLSDAVLQLVGNCVAYALNESVCSFYSQLPQNGGEIQLDASCKDCWVGVALNSSTSSASSGITNVLDSLISSPLPTSPLNSSVPAPAPTTAPVPIVFVPVPLVTPSNPSPTPGQPALPSSQGPSPLSPGPATPSPSTPGSVPSPAPGQSTFPATGSTPAPAENTSDYRFQVVLQSPVPSVLLDRSTALQTIQPVAASLKNQSKSAWVNITASAPAWGSTFTTSARRLQQAVPGMQWDVLLHSVPPPGVTLDSFKAMLNQAFGSQSLPGVAFSVDPLDVSAPAPQPSTPPAPTPHEAEQNNNSTSKSTLSTGGIIGIVCGAAVLLIAAAAAALLLIKRHKRGNDTIGKQQHSQEQTWRVVDCVVVDDVHESTSTSAAPDVWGHLVSSLNQREVFLQATARCYAWTVSTSLTGPCQAVEAGVNDVQLDRLLQGQQVQEGTACTAVQLTKSELTSQVQLLADGLLGRGGSALVFKCIWPSRFGPNALLAAKVLKDGVEVHMAELQSFAYEANLLSCIQHPHVVKLYGYCLEPPTVCLILELLPVSLKGMLYNSTQQPLCNPDVSSPHHTAAQDVPCSPCTHHSNSTITPSSPDTASSSHEAGTLQMQAVMKHPALAGAGQPAAALDMQANLGNHVLTAAGLQASVQQAAKPLSLLKVVQISRQIACGLAHLHNRELPDEGLARVMSGVKGGSIVHRDLKPANILFSSQGTAKITDFGLARRHEQTTIATVNVGAGTLAYMAPELLVAARVGTDHALTNRVDIYSLGLMIWEMLAGEAPWHGLTETAILAAVINRRRPPLTGNDIDREHVTLEREGLTQSSTSFTRRHQEAGLSQLNNIIMSCWHHRELRRPAASAVLGMLTALEGQLEAQ